MAPLVAAAGGGSGAPGRGHLFVRQWRRLPVRRLQRQIVLRIRVIFELQQRGLERFLREYFEMPLSVSVPCEMRAAPHGSMWW